MSVRQAIMDGRLWEYVGQKARAHPKLMEAFKLFMNYEYLEDGNPLFKKKAVFFMDSIDQYRPEASRLRKVFNSFSTNKKKLVLYPDTRCLPYCSQYIINCQLILAINALIILYRNMPLKSDIIRRSH